MDFNRLCLCCMREKPDHENPCPFCGEDSTVQQGSLAALPMGTILNDRYIIGKVLGEGGFGITYIGYDVVEERTIAVKEYFPGAFAERNMSSAQTMDIRIKTDNKNNDRYFLKGKEGFQREVVNLSGCTGLEGIIQILDYFEANSTAYLVMSYIKGITLEKYMKLKGQPLEEDELLTMLEPVIRSLVSIHKRHLIHRDITPGNILVSGNKMVTLIDFGSSRTSAIAKGLQRTVLVTHGFAPPEQYLTKGNQGPWTDIYSLCATMYYLLSMEKPKNAMERKLDQSKDNFRSILNLKGIHLSEDTISVIEKGMQIEIEDRYLHMEQLYADLYRKRILLSASKDQTGTLGESKSNTAVKSGNSGSSDPERRQVSQTQQKNPTILIAAAIIGGVVFLILLFVILYLLI